ncbi:GNAT family N-acetyltransferase [Paenibacillus sp. LMG 31458]|uniref:GNAT family N-acetyltransferase n=1 Tax=Paenibacillus phytorum TaxID=2654977 RepID=A0ABX1XWX5_9BACL|nr:GNAT family N-acetyltransferase [Paenibacillus phytorum]NOU73053.1 GNAT family N-acetyltransferase [Paenibacillus phytorum]
MEEVRLLRTNEFKAAVRLSDAVFRDAEQVSMGRAYPSVFSPGLGQSFGYFIGGRLVSFAGLVPSQIHIGPATLSVYSIGSVCTDPDYTGRGYAGEVLRAIKEHSLQAGAALIVVSGAGGIYERVGCRPFGQVASFCIEATSKDSIRKIASAELLHIREMAPIDWFEIARLAGERSVRYGQSLWDLAALIHAEPLASNRKLHHKVWVATGQGRLHGYAVACVPSASYTQPRGRPTVIEWGGRPDIVAAIIANGYEREQLEEMEIAIPWHEKELTFMFESSACACKRSRMKGTAMVVHAEILIRQLAPYLQQKNDEAFRQLQVATLSDGSNRLSWKGQTFTCSDQEILSLLFDHEPKLSMSDKMKSGILKLFPVPFPSTSGLNYI